MRITLFKEMKEEKLTSCS